MREVEGCVQEEDTYIIVNCHGIVVRMMGPIGYWINKSIGSTAGVCSGHSQQFSFLWQAIEALSTGDQCLLRDDDTGTFVLVAGLLIPAIAKGDKIWMTGNIYRSAINYPARRLAGNGYNGGEPNG
ncbi:GM21282 [Drosophila sechellia]|uniref:GM21282 n=1 Tax=Drosophila sechellia TaxID=7238 RepID=B4HNF8_DROSE|nr:GM21282 [Drosophila sechellia]